jgi:hypothetical protein
MALRWEYTYRGIQTLPSGAAARGMAEGVVTSARDWVLVLEDQVTLRGAEIMEHLSALGGDGWELYASVALENQATTVGQGLWFRRALPERP